MSSKFSPEFKSQLVGEVIRTGRSVAGVAREYGIGAETLRHWVKKYRAEHAEDEPQLSGSERVELERLRREVRELKMEQEFLKKAAAFFATEYR